MILVVGGSGGIGAEVCRALGDRKLRPIVTYANSRERAETIAAASNGKAIPLDLCSPKSIAQTVDALAGMDELLDGVVLAASAPLQLISLSKVTDAEATLHWQINVAGPLELLRLAIPRLMQPHRRGVVVGVLSAAMEGNSGKPVKGFGPYVIAKFGMQGLLAVLEAEWPWLTVRSVKPGYTDTPLLGGIGETFVDYLRRRGELSDPVVVAKGITEAVLA